MNVTLVMYLRSQILNQSKVTYQQHRRHHDQELGYDVPQKHTAFRRDTLRLKDVKYLGISDPQSILL